MNETTGHFVDFSSKSNPGSSSGHRLHPEEHITPAMLLTLVDDIGIAREMTRVDFTDKSIKPAELWNAASSSRTSATVRRTGWG